MTGRGGMWNEGPDSLTAVLERLLDDVPTISGAVTWLETREGVSFARSVGSLTQERLDPVPVDASYRLASNTKTFAAATVLRMAEDGLVSLARPIVELLPRDVTESWESVPGFRYLKEIRLVHLLGHTSGLPSPANTAYMELVLQAPDKRWDPLDQIAVFVGDQSPTARPGARAVYSDTGYVVLALVIEEITGMGLAESYRTLLGFDRLGLSSTYLETCEPPPPELGPRAHQYFRAVDVTPIDPSFDLYGAGGLVSSSRDLCRFWRGLFSGEVFRDAATLQTMCTTVPFADRAGGAGLGLFRRDIAGQLMWCHTGYFGTFAVHDPSSGVTAAGLANQAGSEWPASRSLDDLLSAVVRTALQTSWSSG